MEEEQIVESQLNDQPLEASSFLTRRKMVIIGVGLVVLLVLFTPLIGGKSLVERFFVKVGVKVEEENLVPNPSFEEGSGSKPAGWTTESKTIVD